MIIIGIPLDEDLEKEDSFRQMVVVVVPQVIIQAPPRHCLVITNHPQQLESHWKKDVTTRTTWIPTDYEQELLASFLPYRIYMIQGNEQQKQLGYLKDLMRIIVMPMEKNQVK
eukprot:TRINITY_DN49418_c0_g1_i1.p2 TRINITY_DN49418_c0_g1~~TRINITY_DN49418_c0_g1_i1.p2  ORF type:complete len:113 (+),score=10.88 TRINITY_DN49418_c0_g1_i1:1-339(+)